MANQFIVESRSPKNDAIELAQRFILETNIISMFPDAEKLNYIEFFEYRMKGKPAKEHYRYYAAYLNRNPNFKSEVPGTYRQAVKDVRSTKVLRSHTQDKQFLNET